MTPFEMWLGIVTNTLVSIFCLVVASILIKTWQKVKGSGFPRWCLIAMMFLYVSYSIRRLLNVGILLYPMWPVVVWYDVISAVFTGIGMIGQLAKAKWVREHEQVTSDHLQEKDLEIQELQAKLKLYKIEQSLEVK